MLDQGRRLYDNVGGVSAIAPNAKVAGRAEHLPSQPLGGTVDNNAGKIAPRRTGEDGIGHQAGCCLDVGGVDPCRLDLDDHVSWSAPECMPFER